MLKKIGLIVLVAIVIGAIAHFLKWFQGRLALSMLVAFVGAIVGLLVHWAIDKHPVEMLTRPLALVSIVAGSIAISFVISNFPLRYQTQSGGPRTISVWIKCVSPDGPEVYSNSIAASAGDIFKFMSDKARPITIQFQGPSPFNSTNLSAPIGSNIQPQTVRSSVVSGNYFSYTVSCSPGGTGTISYPHTPMIQIPRQY